jgi:DNA replication protein DnaC
MNPTTAINLTQKTDGANSKKLTKYCEFCGQELEQLKWGDNFYISAYKACECEESKKARAEVERLKAQKQKEEKIKYLYEKSAMSKRARNCKFLNYQLNIYNSDAYKICREYAENFDKIKNKAKNGLFIAGECGVGKSHIAFATANELIENEKRVICTSMIDLLADLRGNFQNSVTEVDTLAKYTNCELLIIDDLGKEKPTEWALQMIYSIVDHRYNELKPIIVTTNYTATDLIKRFTVSNDNATASAIIDRLYEMCQYLPLRGESFRKR